MATADFSQLEAEVARIKQVRPSVVAIIDGIADRVQAAVDADNAGDNTKLASLAADLRAEGDALAEAAVRGTPVSNEPPASDTGSGTTDGVVTGDSESGGGSR
jgi:hypothetical protein